MRLMVRVGRTGPAVPVTGNFAFAEPGSAGSRPSDMDPGRGGRWLAATAGLVLAVVVLCGCGATEPSSTRSGAAGGGWEALPDAPLSGRTGAHVTEVGDRVLVVGGWSFLCPPNADCSGPEEPPMSDGAVLDLTTGTWRSVADAPFGLHGGRSAVVGDEVYLATGCRDDPYCSGRPELLRYDASADRWAELGPMPRDLRYADLVAVGGDLLAAPTSDEHGEVADHLYDVAAGTWVALPDDPLEAAYDRHVVVDGGRVLVFGSTLDDAGEQDVKVGAALDLASLTWSRLPDSPGSGYQVWRVGDEAWLNPHYSDGGGVLDLRDDTWSAFPAGPVGPGWERDLAGVLGEGTAIYEYDAGWVRDTRTDGWLRVPERPGEGYDESLTAVGDALFVFGGQRWQQGEGELLSEAWVWRPPAA